MGCEPMPFFEAFPTLQVNKKLTALLEASKVTRLTINQAKNRLHVYLESPNWIAKKSVYEIEKAIKEQIFPGAGMDVKVAERFCLSAQYTPAHFYEVYRSSMLLELGQHSPLMHEIFRSAEVTVEEGGLIRLDIPDSIVSEEMVDRIRTYVEKVFVERAGFVNAEVTCTLHEVKRKDLFGEDDRRIAERVSRLRKGNEARHEKPVQEKLPEKKEKRTKAKWNPLPKDPDLILGRPFEGEPERMDSIGEEPRNVVVKGEVFAVDSRQTRSGRIIFTISLTDYTDSLRMKLWADAEEEELYAQAFRKGACFAVSGLLDFDPYDKELMLRNVTGVRKIPPFKEVREDTAPVKRVELHCHTKMSDMDAVSSAQDILKQAYRFGMKALAITDHGVVQAFPEALKTIGAKDGIPKDADFKIIYGMEAYLVDDTRHLVSGAMDGNVQDPVVVFSTVTTGQSPKIHDMLELSAVKLIDGQVTEEYTALIDPGRPIPFSIQTETGITDELVSRSGDLKDALTGFLEFAGDLPLAAYDADQEMNFIAAGCASCGIPMPAVTWVDIPAVVRFLVPDIGRIRFARLAKYMKVPCTDPMRAFPRARCMALVLAKLQGLMDKAGITTYAELDAKGALSPDRIRNLRYYHAIILAKNETGRRNLYTLVSESHLNYFRLRPRVPRSLLNKYREGLVLGSACSAGELYQALLSGASDAEIARIVGEYDYLEIQPTANNHYLLADARSGMKTEADLQEINRKIVRLGEQFGKPVVATCDVHFLNPGDAIYRAIIQAGHGYKEEGGQPPLFLRTTDEMLAEFAYLGEEKAREVVVTNTNLIADWIEKISPIYPDKCPPSIPHSEEDLQAMCYARAKEIYGDPIPEIVKTRLDRELGSIIKNGYAVMYIIAQKLVDKSRQDGYLVGSRGSVGSSLVATMSQITEVNPLPPHYYCPHCHYNEFDSEETRKAKEEGRCGCDMPDKLCPNCGQPLAKEGMDIPFETFLGFKGDKEPDIDLNFSGDEQGIAQAYTEVIFGTGQTFKAGTIGTVADKTAYGYAMHYFEDKGQTKRRCELERLSAGCVGVRRTTGQHPGGVIVLPKGMDINWFTPVQHPANDTTSDIVTTHFDYHSIDKNLLKLDILGHDDPTIIRMLEDLTGEDPLKVPLDDKGVLSLFTSTDALGVKPDDIGCDLGTLGVPEFGTKFVIGMLKDTKPKTFSELIRISGLSHGTNVWLDNAQYYIARGDCTLGTAICTRDDIMLNLIQWGVEPEHSFKIMEAVRKGKGLTPEQEAEMREHGVPDWYIESCKKIKYMFPKAHAAAYVMNAFRIAYYKINYPLAYYAAFFSIRAKTFDYGTMCQGREKLEYEADKLRHLADPTQKEQDTLDDMKLVREMYARGFSFHRLDLYKAKATRCQVIDGKIMPALSSVDGLGDTQAVAIEQEAAKAPFLSKDDLRERTHVSKTVVDLLDEYGVLGEIPESNQISLFDYVNARKESSL